MSQPIVHDLQSLSDTRHVLTIGSFDGVHRGHQYLLSRVVNEARGRGIASLVVTFDPLPAEVLRPDKAPTRISTTEERTREILNSGIDRVALLTFDQALASRTADDFLDDIRLHARPEVIVVGNDFAFGHKRQGTPEFLQQRAHSDGFELQVIERHNPTSVEWSSSFVRRQLIDDGNVTRAAEALGRYPGLSGRVRDGDHRGRELGYPTANLAVPDRLTVPADGIYAAMVAVHDSEPGTSRPALVYVGTRPTFGGTERIVEVFLLNFRGDLYDRTISLHFVDRIRGDRRFDTVEELVEQMKRDEAAGREIFANLGIIIAAAE